MRTRLARAATWLAAVGVLLETAGGPHATAGPHDVAVWVYGAHRWTDPGATAALGRLPAGARRLYLSVEDGPRLVLDDPGDARRLGAILDAAGEGASFTVEAMLLQDPGWASDPDGAAARVARVLDFHAARRAAGRPAFAGLHFDVEPYTDDAWVCGDAAGRRALVRGLQAVYGAIARRAAPWRAGASPLRLTAALPWWLGPLSAEVPEAAPGRWLADLDEVVLMVYGDAGGAVVGDSAAAVLGRVDDDRLWREAAAWPPGRGLRIGLATYEYRDAAALAAGMREMAAVLAPRSGFRGFAIFGHGQPFDAPRGAALEGRVVDRDGRPVAGAHVRAGAESARSNRCGLFALRRLPAPAVEVTVEADGFRPARRQATGLVAGRQTDFPPIVLERP
jgi:hypothetical protein